MGELAWATSRRALRCTRGRAGSVSDMLVVAIPSLPPFFELVLESYRATGLCEARLLLLGACAPQLEVGVVLRGLAAIRCERRGYAAALREAERRLRGHVLNRAARLVPRGAAPGAKEHGPHLPMNTDGVAKVGNTIYSLHQT